MDHRIGSHTAHVEEDILYVVLRGTLEASDLQQILGLAEAVIARHGRYAGLVDVSQMGTMTLEARRLGGKWSGFTSCFGNFFFGASFATRTMFALTMRGVLLFGGQPIHTEFCASEAEARTRLAERRPPRRAVR